MTTEQKIAAEFRAIFEANKKEGQIIMAKYIEDAKNAPKIERKRPTLKYTIEDVTPEGYGN